MTVPEVERLPRGERTPPSGETAAARSPGAELVEVIATTVAVRWEAWRFVGGPMLTEVVELEEGVRGAVVVLLVALAGGCAVARCPASCWRTVAGAVEGVLVVTVVVLVCGWRAPVSTMFGGRIQAW